MDPPQGSLGTHIWISIWIWIWISIWISIYGYPYGYPYGYGYGYPYRYPYGYPYMDIHIWISIYGYHNINVVWSRNIISELQNPSEWYHLNRKTILYRSKRSKPGPI